MASAVEPEVEGCEELEGDAVPESVVALAVEPEVESNAELEGTVAGEDLDIVQAGFGSSESGTGGSLTLFGGASALGQAGDAMVAARLLGFGNRGEAKIASGSDGEVAGGSLSLHSCSSTNSGGSVSIVAGGSQGAQGGDVGGPDDIQPGWSAVSKSGAVVIKSGDGVESGYLSLATGDSNGGVDGLSGDFSVTTGTSNLGSSGSILGDGGRASGGSMNLSSGTSGGVSDGDVEIVQAEVRELVLDPLKINPDFTISNTRKDVGADFASSLGDSAWVASKSGVGEQSTKQSPESLFMFAATPLKLQEIMFLDALLL